MGKSTGRPNKHTSESPAPQQTASCEPTSLTILSEPNGQWSWVIEHYGKTYTSGIPPASGPSRFNELSSATSSAEANYHAACWMRRDQRRLENAKRSTQPSPG